MSQESSFAKFISVMRDLQIDILAEFTEAASRGRCYRRDPFRRKDYGGSDSIWRQHSTPMIEKAAALQRHVVVERERYQQNPAVRAAAAERYRRQREEELEAARREQDERVRREAMKMSKLARHRYVAKDALAADRALCSECKKKLPGQGWCPLHTTEKGPMREKLPDDRPGLIHKFTIIAKTSDGDGVRETEGYIRTGEYVDDGGSQKRLGEIFLTVGKPGSTEAMYDQFAIAASMALQHGVPVDAFFKKFLGSRFEPSGATKNKDIPRCSSVLDYVARWCLQHYGE